MKIFGLDLDRIVDDAFGSLRGGDPNGGAITLRKIVTGARATSTSGNASSVTDYTARAIVTATDVTDRVIDSSADLPSATRVRVILFGASLPSGVTPAINDQIVDAAGAIYTITSERYDAARAAFVIVAQR